MESSTVTDDRAHILLEQLDAAWELLAARLAERQPFAPNENNAPFTMTDEEYFWEPVDGCWNLRPRERVAEGVGIGRGDWLLESAYPAPQPPPVTTIAWRVSHLALGFQMRYDWTFGAHAMQPQDAEWPATAAQGLAMLDAALHDWRNAIFQLPTDELSMIGRSQFPYGLDAQVRFIDLVGWVNLEFAHHAAEIGLLRDLYRARG
jgi:hypothetical protein